MDRIDPTPPAGGMMRLAIAILLVLAGCRPPSERAPVRVYAAASLTDVLEVFADTFEARNPNRVVLNVAGSSLLARQIAHGAEADVYVSAHPDWTTYLLQEGKIERVKTLRASNRLVLVTNAAAEHPSGRVAIADPDHVPAGMYAREALTCDGRWEELSGRIVPTLDVRAALAAVSEGAAESAIVYASDALLAPGLVTRQAFAAACRPEVRYTAAAVRRTDDSRRFVDLLDDPAFASVWRRFGFVYQH